MRSNAARRGRSLASDRHWIGVGLAREWVLWWVCTTWHNDRGQRHVSCTEGARTELRPNGGGTRTWSAQPVQSQPSMTATALTSIK